MKKSNSITSYLQNCFLLMIPILVWNVLLTGHLPAAYRPSSFQQGIPQAIAYGENIFRTGIFVLTLLMPLSIKTGTQKKGLLLYISGCLIYFASWIALIYYPNSPWSRSFPGFLAPACTPALWLMGIALIGRTYYFNLPCRRWIFLAISILFLLFHNIHTFIVFNREQPV